MKTAHSRRAWVAAAAIAVAGSMVASVSTRSVQDPSTDSVPIAEQGRNRKKALVVISDGNDTTSIIGTRSLRAKSRGRSNQSGWHSDCR